MTFKDLHIIEPILRAVEEEGYTHPTPIQEQSIPIIELITNLSFGSKVFSEKGSKTNPLEPIFFIFLARPNLTIFAAVHFFGSS